MQDWGSQTLPGILAACEGVETLQRRVVQLEQEKRTLQMHLEAGSRVAYTCPVAPALHCNFRLSSRLSALPFPEARAQAPPPPPPVDEKEEEGDNEEVQEGEEEDEEDDEEEEDDYEFAEGDDDDMADGGSGGGLADPKSNADRGSGRRHHGGGGGGRGPSGVTLKPRAGSGGLPAGSVGEMMYQSLRREQDAMQRRLQEIMKARSSTSQQE